MLISRKHKFIFIHNQKTGGSSIWSYLKDNVDDLEMYLPQHAWIEDAVIPEGYFVFGFVRNPWDRMVSWYNMMITNRNVANPFWLYCKENSHDFRSFLKNCTETVIEKMPSGEHKKNFARLQLDYFTKDGKVVADFIGRYENLENDFNYIVDKLKLPKKPLPKVGANSHEDYKTYYTDETKAIITERFKKDIEYFNYTFE